MGVQRRKLSATSRHWVFKVGSAIVTNAGEYLAEEWLDSVVNQLANIIAKGYKPVVVSSGAIALGRIALGIDTATIQNSQVCAAVGQMSLTQAYQTRFTLYGLRSGQVLLTHDDLANRRRYLNARATMQHMLKLGVIPIVNENDSVATQEIGVGDNDSLAASICNLVAADCMVLLTDQQGVYDADPRGNPNATFIEEIQADDPLLQTLAVPSKGVLGKGGMATKIKAAKLAARSGTSTIIADGNANNVVEKCVAGEKIGTLIRATITPSNARRQWLASQLKPKGMLRLDGGAIHALRYNNASVLAVGVIECAGVFGRGDLVECVNPAGVPVARGLINYSQQEVAKIIGKKSSEISNMLGYSNEPELIDRTNFVMV